MEDDKSQSASFYPHDDLDISLHPLRQDEIRILVLLPGDSHSPLQARFSTLLLEPPLPDHPYEPDGPTHFQPSKWVRLGDNLYQTRLDYDGQGAEVADDALLDTSVALSYDAISYVWGEPIYSHEVELEGHGILRITKSLAGALNRFRSRESERRLWADAICINQADMKECSAQVAIMARVYQRARNVLVWLGPALEDGALAFAAVPAYLEAHDEGPDQLWQRFKSILQVTLRCPCCSLSFKHLDSSPIESLVAIAHLLQRPWFSRLWVVQEVYGKTILKGRATVFCGSHQMPYPDLRDVSQAIRSDVSLRGTIQVFSGLPDDALERIRLAWSTPNPLEDWFTNIEDWGPSYLLRTLAAMSLRDCSDPRDRVYAVRAMMNLEHEPSLLPDYELTRFEVYKRLVCVLLERFKQRDEHYMDQPWALLALAGTYPEDQCDAARLSWVPDFHALTARSRARIEQYTRIQWLEVPQFMPSARLFSGSVFEEHGNLLLRASCFATIETIFRDTEYPVLHETDSDHVSEVELTAFRAWYTRCISIMNVHESQSDEVISHSASFLACNIQLAQLPREMEDIEGATDYSNGWLFPDRWPGDPNAVREHFMLLCASAHTPPDKARVIARITVRGEEPVYDFCWVPPQAEPGDQVCVVAGAPFPFVLRKQHDGLFKILGDGFLANTTLKRALGEKGKWRFEEDVYEEVDHPVNDVWDVEDEEMKVLVDAMDEIVIV